MDRPKEMYTKFCLKKLNGILSMDLRIILNWALELQDMRI
jgi:hypothetical protein